MTTADPSSEQPAQSSDAENEETQAEDNHDQHQRQFILSHYAKQAPSWRAKRRRRRNVTACATDVIQRLQTASDELYQALTKPTQMSQSGVTLPISALAWILAWDDTTSTRPLVAPWPRAPRQRQWRALRHHLCTHVQQLRLVNEQWPPIHAPRKKRRTHALELNESGEAFTWLRAYYDWQTRPGIDLECFEHLVFVWMQGVPPEYVTMHPQIKVLRVQHSGFQGLSALLPLDNTMLDASHAGHVLSNLTHLKIMHCNLLSLVLRSGEDRHVTPILPVLCPQLQTLNLAHNALTDQAITEAGLDQLEELRNVDLSFNYLRGMWRCGTPNWTRLNLAHNEINSIGRGIAQLYGLTNLDLSHNHLRYISRVVRLAHLPLLQDVRLYGNPVSRSSSNRELLWDLFRQARDGDLADLPSIDGRLPSLFFSTATNQTRPADSLKLPSPLPVVRTISRSNELCWDTSGGVAHEPGSLFVSGQGSKEIVSEIPVKFDAWQLLESLPSTTCASVEDMDDEKKEDDVVIMADDKKEAQPGISNGGKLAESSVWSDNEPESPPSVEELELNKHVEDNGDQVDEKIIDSSPVRKTAAPQPAEASQSKGGNVTYTEASDIMTADLTSSGNTETPKSPEAEGVSVTQTEMNVTPAKPNTSFLDHNGSFLSVASSSEQETPKTPAADISAISSSGRVADPSPSSFGSPVRTSFHVAFPDHVWQDETNSVAQSSTAMSYPDTAGSGFEEVKVYETAEAKSTFIGPQKYAGLIIRENLELYFRLFVFSQAVAGMSSFLDSSMDGDWQSILELYPRIQLWPIDRRLRDATTPDLSVGGNPTFESFCRVWIENVVACGKPALRRLTPNLTARLGFHGELMWSTNAVHLRQEAVSTHRMAILCFSSSAFYVILDHDAVTEKAKGDKRRFPLPLPIDACFLDAKWPHALARHPFSMLRKVIIGFGFQRLTLRFSNSSFPSPEDFTYVMLTGKKLTTISILKDVQEIAEDSKQSSGFDKVVIENDDFQVLEALGKAVAPDVIGVVFHYQILEQRWKHGDRPNVRRVLVVTDTNIYLLDEDYLGDGATRDTMLKVSPDDLGLPLYRLVDSASLGQIGQLHTGTDPTMITLVIRPTSRLSRIRNWRLVCRDRQGAERLVEDVQKAIGSAA